MRNKKSVKLCVLMTVLALVFSSFSSFGYTGVEEWFSDEINRAELLGVIPGSLMESDMSYTVTRREFCEAALEAYDIFRDTEQTKVAGAFKDTADESILKAVTLGIANGYTDGTFRPDNNISRQEMCKMITNLMTALGDYELLVTSEAYAALIRCSDVDDIQDWALVSVGTLISKGIIKGNEKGNIQPMAFSTRSQAVVMITRAVMNVIDEGTATPREEVNEKETEDDLIKENEQLIDDDASPTAERPTSKDIVSASSAFGYTGVEEWAEREITRAEELGVIPESLQNSDMSYTVTRREFCEAALEAYDIFHDTEQTKPADAFSDTDDESILKAVTLGIANGYTDGSFKPDNVISRQEMCKMIANLMTALDDNDLLVRNDAYQELSGCGDIDDIQDWALVSVGTLKYKGIINGDEKGNIKPLASSTRSQAIVMITRAVTWVKDTPRESSLSTFLKNSKLTALEYNDEKHAYIFGSADAPKYQSEEEAYSHMTTITVPVWYLRSDGTKTASKTKLVVNGMLADVISAIFEEIYNGDEKFPINSVGCYDWRSDSSNTSHKWGVAIDINPGQNYYISTKDGKVLSGEKWLPGEDPLSIPADGDVVKAFAKYGFAWGGTAWTSSKDYMHFCFFAN